MKSSRHAALVAALVFAWSGCNSSDSDEEVVATCDRVCDRLEECGTDFTVCDSMVDCDTNFTNKPAVLDCHDICTDIDELSNQLSQSCKDAMTVVLECTESLECSILGALDFTKVGEIMSNPAPPDSNTSFTSFPAPILADPDCFLQSNNAAYDFCVVNSDCVRFNIFNTRFVNCYVQPFDMLTIQVDDCEAEYIAMVQECNGEPLP